MQYKKFGNKIIARVDRGEEIISALGCICAEQNIKLAQVTAIGAVGEFTVGVFRTAQKQYKANSFCGDYEIVSLGGTVTTMNGEFYAHLHMSAGDGEGRVFGGHLNRAVVSATCEMVITIVDGEVGREFDESVGLNLFKFLN